MYNWLTYSDKGLTSWTDRLTDLLDSFYHMNILKQFLHDDWFELFKPLNGFAYKHQNIKCCLFIGITQKLHQLNNKTKWYKLVSCLNELRFIKLSYKLFESNIILNLTSLPWLIRLIEIQSIILFFISPFLHTLIHSSDLFIHTVIHSSLHSFVHIPSFNHAFHTSFSHSVHLYIHPPFYSFIQSIVCTYQWNNRVGNIRELHTASMKCSYKHLSTNKQQQHVSSRFKLLSNNNNMLVPVLNYYQTNAFICTWNSINVLDV